MPYQNLRAVPSLANEPKDVTAEGIQVPAFDDRE
jgi:hypothetical protein